MVDFGSVQYVDLGNDRALDQHNSKAGSEMRLEVGARDDIVDAAETRCFVTELQRKKERARV